MNYFRAYILRFLLGNCLFFTAQFLTDAPVEGSSASLFARDLSRLFKIKKSVSADFVIESFLKNSSFAPSLEARSFEDLEIIFSEAENSKKSLLESLFGAEESVNSKVWLASVLASPINDLDKIRARKELLDFIGTKEKELFPLAASFRAIETDVERLVFNDQTKNSHSPLNEETEFYFSSFSRGIKTKNDKTGIIDNATKNIGQACSGIFEKMDTSSKLIGSKMAMKFLLVWIGWYIYLQATVESLDNTFNLEFIKILRSIVYGDRLDDARKRFLLVEKKIENAGISVEACKSAVLSPSFGKDSISKRDIGYCSDYSWASYELFRRNNRHNWIDSQWWSRLGYDVDDLRSVFTEADVRKVGALFKLLARLVKPLVVVCSPWVVIPRIRKEFNFYKKTFEVLRDEMLLLKNLLTFVVKARKIFGSLTDDGSNQLGKELFLYSPKIEEMIRAQKVFVSKILAYKKNSGFGELGQNLVLYKQAYKNRDAFLAMYHAIGQVLAYLKITELSRCSEFSAPELVPISQDSILEIKDLWSPQVSSDCVKNNVILSVHGPRIALVSGPNAGGKTQIQRSIATSAIMAQSLLFVPAKSYKGSVFSQFFTHIAKKDNPSKGKSFHWNECETVANFQKQILNSDKNNKFLMVLDELFNGTDPIKATELSNNILLWMGQNENLLGLVSTHFLDVCNLEDTYPLIFKNFRVGAMRDKLFGKIFFDYKFIPGRASPEDSTAVDVALEAGVLKESLVAISSNV